jgi:TolB protein
MLRLLAAAVTLGLVLTAQPGPAHAHLRRDAGAIVYVSDRDSTNADDPIDEIYLIDPRARSLDRLTYDLPGVERWPVVSPDGRSLAWVRWGSDAQGYRPDLSDLYRCNLRFRAGSWSCRNAEKVVGPVQDNAIAWTPDSRKILYSEPIDADGDADIYAVNLRSLRTRNLTREAAADGIGVQNNHPTVSPDGRHFVYSRGAPGPTLGDLYRRDIGGTNPLQLTAAPFNDIAADYSPDGNRLVFHSTRATGTSPGDADIYLMRAAAEGPANPAVNLTEGLRSKDGRNPSQERAPSFSPDGRQVAFWWFTEPAGGPTAGYTDGEIYRMRIDGSRVRNLTNNNPSDPTALTVGDIQPDWGPSPTRRRHR